MSLLLIVGQKKGSEIDLTGEGTAVTIGFQITNYRYSNRVGLTMAAGGDKIATAGTSASNVVGLTMSAGNDKIATAGTSASNVVGLTMSAGNDKIIAEGLTASNIAGLIINEPNTVYLRNSYDTVPLNVAAYVSA